MMYGKANDEDHDENRGAVLVVLINPDTEKFVLVVDPSKKMPQYTKFAGGGISAKDVDPKNPFKDEITALNAAKRETQEETCLTDVDFLPMPVIRKKTHRQYLFLGMVHYDRLEKYGITGEIISEHSLEEIRALKNFHPEHVRILDMALEFLQRP